MPPMSHESCPSTRSTWLLTRKAIFLPLHLFPSAPTKGRAASLEGNYLRWTTWPFVTSFNQPSLKASSATHLTVQRWKKSRQNQANPMAFSFCWILAHTTWIRKTTMHWSLNWPSKPSRSLSTLWHNTPLLDLDLMQWPLWRKRLGQKALCNFLTTRGNALFTTRKSASLKDIWIKSKKNAIVCHGLSIMTR